MRDASAPAWSAAPLPAWFSPQAVGRAATLALHDELALSPKPGLVTLVDSGSHDDMDARSFMRSLLALRGYFVRMADLGATAGSTPTAARSLPWACCAPLLAPSRAAAPVQALAR